MRYYSYNSKGTNITFIGTTKKQIEQTLMHYSLPVPHREEMRELPRVKVMCAFDPPRSDHFFQANIADRVSFRVHANAFEHIKQVSREYSGLKRGALYKFNTGRKDHGLIFLPEHIMKAMGSYNWDRHKNKVEGWRKSEKACLPESDETGQFFIKPT